MADRIKTAVFPVAGLGTRFLPATKAMPKEMLTVVDKPVIQWVVEEAREAGIEHFVFVTGRNKSVIEDHFDRQYELEDTLRKKGKLLEVTLLESDLPSAGKMSFTRQQRPLGLGHAVWCARQLVGERPFALLLPDMLVQGPRGCLAQMVEAHARTGGNMIAVEQVPPEQTHRYGIVGVGEKADETFEITSMVEKPAPGDAPSNLMIMGRYILQPQIFSLLERQAAGTGDEIQLTDAMQRLLEQQAFHGFEFEGRTFDCGDKVGFLAANIAYGLARDDIRERFRAKLDEILLKPMRKPAAAAVAGAAATPAISAEEEAPVEEAAASNDDPDMQEAMDASPIDQDAARHDDPQLTPAIDHVDADGDEAGASDAPRADDNEAVEPDDDALDFDGTETRYDEQPVDHVDAESDTPETEAQDIADEADESINEEYEDTRQMTPSQDAPANGEAPREDYDSESSEPATR